VLSFSGKKWFEEIADETGKRDYQTCDITLADPSEIAEEYNYDTGKYEVLGDGVFYIGQARLIAVRRGVNYEGSTQNNAKTITSIRIQIPSHAAARRVQRGTIARVTSAPHNPTLETYTFTLSSDIHGSSAATRTFEFNVDGDSRGA